MRLLPAAKETHTLMLDSSKDEYIPDSYSHTYCIPESLIVGEGHGEDVAPS